MFEKAVALSIRMRKAIIVLFVLLLAAGGVAARTLKIDAMPDVSTVQVAVLTKTGGLSATEAEERVNVPIENALNGVPGSVEIRSMATSGAAATTLVFRDSVDPWFARQLVLERLRGIEAELPPSVGTPELGPLSTGLGEIFTFVVRSNEHSPMHLRTLLDWEIVPKIRKIAGVTEVNTMGGDLKQYQVEVDRRKLAAFHLTLAQVVDALRAANQNVGGGYVERGTENYVIRGEGRLLDLSEIGEVVVTNEVEAGPIVLSRVAKIGVGPALKYGVITHNGENEAVGGIVMMLLGANSRDVTARVAQRVADLSEELPPGVHIDVLYDRSEFVGRTLSTVLWNLGEGVAIVAIILALFLGTVRGAIAVVLGIPGAMSIALLGMLVLDVTGDLMSLGAIDFGFLVDGPIVILEAVLAAVAGKSLVGTARARTYDEVSQQTVRPVAFAVSIIMLVYLPLLALEGVEGKMFRPMALTMAMALFGALIYAVFFFPAILVSLMPPPRHHGSRWMDGIESFYRWFLPHAIRRRKALALGFAMLLVASAIYYFRMGAEFVPRIFEGDAVVTIRRAPGIALGKAKELDLATEQVLHEFPEVVATLGMTGRAEVATDVVGSDNTDILVRLAPIEDWQSAGDFDELSQKFKNAIESRVPGTFVSVSQPIEDRTNEIISGSRADVSIQIYGDDLMALTRLSQAIGKRVREIDGTGDVRVERLLGQPVLRAKVNRARMARYGVRVEDAFLVLASVREGIDAGRIYEGARQFEMRVIQKPASVGVEGLGDLRVETMNGETVPLRDVVDLDEGDGPAAVRRIDRRRVVRVDINLRGRDLLSWVNEAQREVAQSVPLPNGYQLEWGGQFENFERASERLTIVVPAVLAIILGMLLATFKDFKFAWAVFVAVPLSLTGGMLGLTFRAMPFSLSAAVGLIALGGIAVLNGVVMGQRIHRLLAQGHELHAAVIEGSVQVMRAVLTTTAVAALGFLPMALSQGAGSEVQRPLATAVAFGISMGALTTLSVLPGIFVLLNPKVKQVEVNE
jgi:cobalt-zinc-cadmium resistance protein CzcA